MIGAQYVDTTPKTVIQGKDGRSLERQIQCPWMNGGGPVQGGNAHLWLRGVRFPRRAVGLGWGWHFLLAFRAWVRRHLARFSHVGEQAWARWGWGMGLHCGSGWNEQTKKRTALPNYFLTSLTSSMSTHTLKMNYWPGPTLRECTWGAPTHLCCQVRPPPWPLLSWFVAGGVWQQKDSRIYHCPNLSICLWRGGTDRGVSRDGTEAYTSSWQRHMAAITRGVRHSYWSRGSSKSSPEHSLRLTLQSPLLPTPFTNYVWGWRRRGGGVHRRPEEGSSSQRLRWGLPLLAQWIGQPGTIFITSFLS